MSLFDNRLNFRESVAFPGPREFINKRPAAGEEYASISLLPTESHRGSVLILQGLHQEGTESAGDTIATASGRQKLENPLGAAARGFDPFWFEALNRSRAAAGTTRATEAVSTRAWRASAGR